LNPLAESFNPQGYVEEHEAVNIINSEPWRSSRLKEKREKLMSRTQTLNYTVSQTADVNNADLACTNKPRGRGGRGDNPDRSRRR